MHPVLVDHPLPPEVLGQIRDLQATGKRAFPIGDRWLWVDAPDEEGRTCVTIASDERHHATWRFLAVSASFSEQGVGQVGTHLLVSKSPAEGYKRQALTDRLCRAIADALQQHNAELLPINPWWRIG